MAFQDIKIPRFWINILPYIQKNYGLGTITPFIEHTDSSGNITIEEDMNLINLISLNSRSLYSITPNQNISSIKLKYIVGSQDLVSGSETQYDGIEIPDLFENINYFYILGHSFSEYGIKASFKINYYSEEAISSQYLPINSDFLNCNPTEDETSIEPDHDGFTIAESSGFSFETAFIKIESFEIIFTKKDNDDFTGSEKIEFSNFGFGTYFDMPHAPELNVSYNKSYDGAKTQKTINGSTLTHFNYSSPPSFGNNGYFELFDKNRPLPKTTRTGVRSWGLSFKGMTNSTTVGDTSLFPRTESYYNFGSDFEDDSFPTNDNIFNENSFFGRVIYPSEGGTIPFIFQADNDNNNPDQFAVCTFRQKSFKISQSANQIYTIRTEILESW
tara:strand:+ start:3203 stop:4363 length:1161 start_codon:yes stop_codon:yes gene_type:complete